MGKSIEERIEALEKKVSDLTREKQKKRIKGLGIGDVFPLAGLTWKILDIAELGYMCQAVDLWKTDQFDRNCNNWEKSALRKELDGLADKIAEEVEADNIIPFERNLISMDGQTEYGTCTDRVSLLEFDEYRKYRSMLPNTDDYWWWLLTPWSTACNDDKTWVTVVSPRGCIYNYICDGNGGVRPFCILSSAIFEFEDK
ncbi:MAG: hypothetical protein HDQ97_00240 [Lachnospiraceae bacterium]|nr:hypothetical protein [Lachnospiraceae bacterium]